MPNKEEKTESHSKIIRVAGLSLVGFCAVSFAADRLISSPVGSQVAGFCGAFLGALAAQRRSRSKTAAPNPEAHQESTKQ
jgi:hypothetical protein